MHVRQQLTLFVPEPAARHVDSVRAIVDPVQAGLIASHVTLRRESELAGIAETHIRERLRAWERVNTRATVYEDKAWS